MQERLQQAADIRLQELAAAQSLNLDVTSKRPSSTKSTWSGKQLEFFKWNNSKGYTDEFITEHKFLFTQLSSPQGTHQSVRSDFFLTG